MYADKNGIERTTIEVIASDIQFLDAKPASSGAEVDPFLPEA